MKNAFRWAVIGAGPAGITAVAHLLDLGIAAKDIAWIDPTFCVGDLGAKWSNVSSNTSVANFLEYLSQFRSFDYPLYASKCDLSSLNPNDTCTLSNIVEPLTYITESFKSQVSTHTMTVASLTMRDGTWRIEGSRNELQAKQVILATGASPKAMSLDGVTTIPFADAIDPIKLAQHFSPNETYAVFGASHSGILILKYLYELGAKHIINFYRSPLRYAVNMGSWTLYDNTGLKGIAATWAKEHIDGTMPDNLTRVYSNEDNMKTYLQQCDKAIYAVGFESRRSIQINGCTDQTYNPHHGIISPGLFGIGIGYPELKPDPYGYQETQVGLLKFAKYIQSIFPVWHQYYA